MKNVILTQKQKKLIEELDILFDLFALDYHKIDKYERNARTSHLKLAKDKIIRGQIILSYTMIDEYLSNEISIYFFGKKRTFQELWKTKKFQNFNHFVIQELTLLQKLRFIKAIVNIPKKIVSDINKLNVLRNGVAHSLFPENRRVYKPIWKGKDIFTLDGIKLFDEDVHNIYEFFYKRMIRWAKE